MRLVVTRPREDADELEAELRQSGHDPWLEPMLDILPVASARIAGGAWQAVLVSSANGVRALARTAPPELRTTPVLCVGEASARAARQAGFAGAEAAGGDLAALADLVRQRCDPDAGPLLYAAGRVVSGDLKGLLEADGFTVEKAVLYDAVEAGRLSEALSAALARDDIDGVLLFSPRTARTWAAACEHSGAEAAARRIVHYCLAPSVAEALAACRGWESTEMRVAEAPNQRSLLELL